jgi:hypothetical protein
VAISPPSDIVLGVALAADPQKYRAAVERLRSLSAAAGADFGSPEWQANVVVETRRDAAKPAGDANPASLVAARAVATPPRQARNAPDAFGQLEAFVLQTFIQSMLPKNASHVFGKGTAGEVWKSMLAEKLANELAKSGQVGLAKRLQAGAAASPPSPAVAVAAAIQPPPSLASVLPYLRHPAPNVGRSADTTLVQSPSSPERS